MSNEQDMREIVSTMEPANWGQWREAYTADCKEWLAECAQNVARWRRMTPDQKRRVADLWREGRGLYTFASCVDGRPELVFDPSKPKVDIYSRIL